LQIGNPEGETKPNKKYYDPRMSLRAGEEAMQARLVEVSTPTYALFVLPFCMITRIRVCLCCCEC